MTLRIIIFDFDGTLVKSREASWELFQLTNNRFELGIDRAEDFYALFQRNFFTALADVLPDDRVRMEQAREHFQELLRTEYSPELVPGIADVVRTLAGSYTLVLLSSNTMQSVRRTLERHGLAYCFAHAFTGDVEPDKAISIRRVLADPIYSLERRCEAVYGEDGRLDAPGDDGAALVTDTVGDIGEALAAGIRAVGVVWGMHTKEELLAAGAEFVAIWPQEILSHLLIEPHADPCICGTTGAAWPGEAIAAARTAADGQRRRRVTAAGVAARRSVEGVETPWAARQPFAGESPVADWASQAGAVDSGLLDAVARICGSAASTPLSRRDSVQPRGLSSASMDGGRPPHGTSLAPRGAPRTRGLHGHVPRIGVRSMEEQGAWRDVLARKLAAGRN